MHNIDSIYLFVFVFAILVSLKNLMKFIGALSQKNPQPLVYRDRELIFLGLAISYIITYFITR